MHMCVFHRRITVAISLMSDRKHCRTVVFPKMLKFTNIKLHVYINQVSITLTEIGCKV